MLGFSWAALKDLLKAVAEWGGETGYIGGSRERLVTKPRAYFLRIQGGISSATKKGGRVGRTSS